MSNTGVTLINSDSTVSTMYMVAATTGNTPANPTNMSLSQISAMSSDVKSFTYDSSNPTTPTTTNSVTQLTNGAVHTYVYVWFGTDPTSNTNTPSTVVTTFRSNGRMLGTSTQNSNLTDPIIQWSGGTDSNGNQIYYTYKKRVVNITNNSSSTIQVKSLGGSSGTIPGVTSGNTCPGTIGLYTSDAISVASKMTATINGAYPSEPYTTIQIWKGTASSLTVGTSTADCVQIINPVLYTNSANCSGSGTTITCTWNASNTTLTITDTNGNGNGGDGGKSNDESCTVGTECASGVCSGGKCVAKDTGGGFPWWGWLLIAIAAIVIIGLIIWAVSRSGKSDSETITPEELAAQQ